ncbi:MAG: MFS transporter [Desulfatitalea sp.]|nr:MFS transporter [Desulfatitalea sp.]
MPKQTLFYGWYIVAACFVLCLLFAGAGFYSFSIFIRPIENEFGWDRAAISLTMSIYLIVGGLAGPPLGQLIQKYGPKRVMRVCAIFAGACFLLVSQTRSLWYFYTIYALLATAVCGIGVIPVSSLLSSWFDKRRGTAIGFALVGISAGGFLLAPGVGWITAAHGWKTAFLIIGLLVWAVGVPVIQFVIVDRPADMGLRPDNAPEKYSGGPHRGVAPDTWITGWPADSVMRSQSFWYIFIAFFLAPMAQMGVLQHQVPLLMDTGVSEAAAAAALGLTAGIGGLGKLGFGRISESLSFCYVMLLCFGLQALALVLLLYPPTPAIIWIYAVTFGFGMGGIVVLMPLVVGHYYGLRSYGFLLGVLWVGNSIGGALGTYLSGVIFDWLGDYRLALVGFTIAYILSIAAFFMAGKPRPEWKNQVPDGRQI